MTALEQALKELVAEVVRGEVLPLLRREVQPEAANEPSHVPVEYLTVADAARIARVDDETVRDWIRSGVLPAGKLPGERHDRLRAEDLHRLLAPGERRMAKAAAAPSAEADRILSLVGPSTASRGGR